MKKNPEESKWDELHCVVSLEHIMGEFSFNENYVKAYAHRDRGREGGSPADNIVLCIRGFCTRRERKGAGKKRKVSHR